MSRRRFGTVRKLASGRWQASYAHAGEKHNAPMTFAKKREAELWLAQREADLSRGAVIADGGTKVYFEPYAREYAARPEIGEKWRATIEILLRVHLAPLLRRTLSEITPLAVRRWHTAALAGKGGRVSIAQAYRFMRAVMGQALRDELITRNPCTIPGAGADRARERRVASVAQLDALVDAIDPPRYRAPVLLAAWCAMRREEVVRLQPDDVDTSAGVVHIREAKSAAGVRTVAIPPHIIPELVKAREWSSEWWMFTSPRGQGRHAMVANTLYHAFVRARESVGLDHLTIHDLRHTGNTLAASAGATTKDLMKRLGHASERAARRYLHTVEGRDGEIAKALSEVARSGDAAALPKKSRRSRTRRHRRRSDLR